MLVTYFLFLLLNLSLLKCASTEDKNENIQANHSETKSETDIFSRHLNEQLLHRILEYVAKSRGRIAMVNKALYKLATESRAFRFYEGPIWDMPELANIWKFGVIDTRNMHNLEAEKAKIMELSDIKNESTFNMTLQHLLVYDKVFKELSSSVLKYLIRQFYLSLSKGNEVDKYGLKRQTYLIFAVENQLYDVFFELGKDPSVWKYMSLEQMMNNGIHDSFYFDCYNDYVYNTPAARDYMLKKMAKIEPKDYFTVHSITPGGEKLSYSELSAWVAVCIYRRTPEEKYAPYLAPIPSLFVYIIDEFLSKFSFITFDDNEKNNFHGFIVYILDKCFVNNPLLEWAIKFTKLLNDVRFGFVNESFYEEQIVPLDEISYDFVAMLIMAASKSNNKLLVKQLAKHPKIGMPSLESMVEYHNPHNFKVFFDIIEGEPPQDVGSNPNYANLKLIQVIVGNKFKISKTFTTPFGINFEIQSPAEYIDLGFASYYEIVLNPENQQAQVHPLIEKMFNDAAKAGSQEFIKLITENCSEQNTELNEFRHSVIRLLLEHQELIEMLANRYVTLTCNDKHIKRAEIANFRHVINPNKKNIIE